MRLVLLRPPRYLWPFNSERSAFWQPLGLLCVAAAARRALPELDLAVWDAPGQAWGWRTLARKLAERPIDVLGLGEETASAHEGLRAAALVKRLHPACVVVAGGVHYPHAIEATLATGCVDVIVRGEGEHTFVELLQCLHAGRPWHDVAGLAFRDAAGRTVLTPPRPLIADLDTLPLPAYDLVDMTRYGRGSRNHPDLVALEHSRGCIDSCGFCVLWKQMGESLDGNGRVRPRYRTKSPARSFDEVRWLHCQYGRRTFGWVDPTFNASPEWSDGWAELMLGSGLMGSRGRPRTLHTAWVRADCVVRDEKLGILSKLVRAGLRQVVLGLERDDPAGLGLLGKHNNDPEMCAAAIAIFREKYPQVYTIGSVIIGLPGDRPDSLRRLCDWANGLGIDYCLMIPLTPIPGTRFAEEAARAGLVANANWADYNFHTPVCTTGAATLRDVDATYARRMLTVSGPRLASLWRGLIVERDARKRRVNWALVRHGARVGVESLWRMLRGPAGAEPASYARRPSWYDT